MIKHFNQEQLLEFKSKLNKFSPIVLEVIKHINILPCIDTIGILLHNMCFDGTDCVNYNFQLNITTTIVEIELLKQISNYYHSAELEWLVLEIENIIQEVNYL